MEAALRDGHVSEHEFQLPAMAADQLGVSEAAVAGLVDELRTQLL